MKKIRIGQIWQEKNYNQRVMRVDDLIMRRDRGADTEDVFAARMVLVSGKGRPRTDIEAHILLSGWTLKEEAPDAPLRIIRLTLAKDTTATECGRCRFSMAGAGHCEIWMKRCEWGAPIPGSKGGREYLRLPECIAAESK